MNITRPNILLYIPLVCSILMVSTFSASAGGFGQIPADEMLLDNPHWVIAVVTVREVTTRKSFEEGRLDVNEILRGRDELSNISHAFWKVPPSQNVRKLWNTWKNETTNRPNEWYERRGQEDWHTEPLETPKPEDKLIVMFLQDQDGRNDPVELVGIYRFSENNKQIVLENMTRAEREATTQFSLLFAILLNPIGCFVVYMSSRSRDLTQGEKRHRYLIILFFTLLQFFIYAFYESGISNWSNIRVDLFLVGPALLASILLGIVNLVFLGKGGCPKATIQSAEGPPKKNEDSR